MRPRSVRPSRRSRSRFAGFVLAAALVASITACSDDGDGTSADPESTTTTVAETTTTAANGVGSDASFAVTGGDLYTPPTPLPGQAHGDLIWAEPVESWWGSPRRAWRVLYRSESVTGEPTAVSGYVIAPPADAATDDGDGLPIVAWGHGTVGSADVCAPSRTFDTDDRSSDSAVAVGAQLTDLVDRGAVVVATDYEGLGTPGPHPFLVGESAGRSILDGAIAVQQLPGANAGADVVVYGASQGGHAALWAGELAGVWAPELDVLGVVAAAPFSEVDLLLPAAATIPGGEGYLAMGVLGQAAANPALDPADVLDPAALERASIIEERCSDEVIVAYRLLAAESGRPVAKLAALTSPEWKEQLASIKPANAPIAAPVLVVQGDRDTTIPAATTRLLVTRMCSADDTVTTVNKPEAGHGDIVIAADAEIRAWLEARLAGEAATSTCPG